MSDETGHKPRLLLMGDARQVHLKRWAKYFVENGYSVFSFSHEKTDSYPGEIRFVESPPFVPRWLRYPMSVPIVRSIFKRFSPDVVNAHFVPNYGVVAALAGRRPWVLSTWGSDVMTDPDKSPFHRMRTLYALRRADYVTSDADVMTERIVSMGVPRGKVLTFPYGVDTDRFYPRTDTLVPGPRIVSNRKLDPVYSVSTLIDAFPGVRETFHSATLTIAGDGELRGDLSRRADRSIGRRGITFVGGVDHERMPALLRDHHIYVSTSLSDTTSVSLLEAMACGLFPVVTDIPANREWIRHGENGMLVPVQQPMKLAMTLIDAWRDERLRERARRENLDLIRARARWTDNMSVVRDLFDRLSRRA